MPRPGLRTSRFRRIIRKIPGGPLVVHYKKKKPRRARCAGCGKPLSGVRVSRGVPKSKRRPKRPYGGNLCPRCSRDRIKGKGLKGRK